MVQEDADDLIFITQTLAPAVNRADAIKIPRTRNHALERGLVMSTLPALKILLVAQASRLCRCRAGIARQFYGAQCAPYLETPSG